MMAMPLDNSEVFSTPDALAKAAAMLMLEKAEKAIETRGEFHCVLAGGTTPRMTYEYLSKASSQWSEWHIYIGDERCLPVDDSERNSLMIEQSLLDHVAIPSKQYYPMPAEKGPELAADMYSKQMPERFDFVLLGMGEDGHTASLFPGHLHSSDKTVLPVYDSPKPPPERVSLSYAVLGDALNTLILVSGAGKSEIVRRWQQGEEFPVAKVAASSKAKVFLDQAAAAGL